MAITGKNKDTKEGVAFLKQKSSHHPIIFLIGAFFAIGALFWTVNQGGIMNFSGAGQGQGGAVASGTHHNTSVMKAKFGHELSAHAKSIPASEVKEGAAIFKTNCVVCHQADAIGKPGVAPSLTNPEFLSLASDKFLLSTIRDGRQGTAMAPYAHLGRSKVKAIVSFLRSHATRDNISKTVDNQPDAHGDARLGKQWYDNICSTCHGLAGNGYMAGGTGTAIGTKGFLNKATDGFIRETIKYGRSNTRMLGFQGPTAMANLNNQEIDDIIVYLRSLVK